MNNQETQYMADLKVVNMRKFSSYGPVNTKDHFCIQRQSLINQCVKQLTGNTESKGDYFTIWAPRQTGKTWLIQETAKTIKSQNNKPFIVACISMQGFIPEGNCLSESFLKYFFSALEDELCIQINQQPGWNNLRQLFNRQKGLFDKPLILFIDEFDTLAPEIIDQIVTLFRDMYLKREHYRLHGLVLVGVRSVMGVDSERASPFNVQRSMKVDNFSLSEVIALFDQYQHDSGQKIKSEVVETIFHITSGQPGLVSWFGELLTEKYNQNKNACICENLWKYVFELACNVEPNNTVINMIAKARKNYQRQIMELFFRSDIPFSFDANWCNYLYMHGIISPRIQEIKKGFFKSLCQFSSPFIQHKLYHALTFDLIEDQEKNVNKLDWLDDLSDVLDPPELNLNALMDRYQNYINRLKEKGIYIWKNQPLRIEDLRPREAIGHFHLYAWMNETISSYCVVTPEFPTGNGQVDIHIQCGNKSGIIEIKSFKDMRQLKLAKHQAVKYANHLSYSSVLLVVFMADVSDEIINTICSQEKMDGINLRVKAISI